MTTRLLNVLRSAERRLELAAVDWDARPLGRQTARAELAALRAVLADVEKHDARRRALRRERHADKPVDEPAAPIVAAP